MDELNKKAKAHPPKPLPDHPVAEGSSQVLLEVGTKVRVLLDEPQDMITGKVHGKFRSVDFKWSPQIRTIKNVLLMPGQPPMYQLDGTFTDDKLSKVAYTKNQLQVVPENEQMPPKELLDKKPPPEPVKKVEAKEKGDEFIGRRVSVLWTNPREWFEGKITKKLPRGLYEVSYDDGNVQSQRLMPKSEGKTWRFLSQ